MNIQCQQCGTSYAVADDKVRGRLMKVRCKSCSEPIRVDGTLLDNTPARASLVSSPELRKAIGGTRSAPPTGGLERPAEDGATWHIAVGDTTQGPYTLDELRDHYRSGAVMLDTLVYCEGAEGDWRPAGDVPELQVKVPAHSQSGALAFSSGVSMGSDPFGDRRGASSPNGSLGGSPRVSAAEMLDGAPKEHTVQFSLDQIRALSSAAGANMPSSPAPQPMSSRASATVFPSRMSHGGSAGYASGDGSGLIDVRKLAELHKAMAAEEVSTLSEPLIPASSSYAHTLAPLSLPLAPAGMSAGRIDGRTKLVAGLAAFGMVLAAAVGVLALTRPPLQANAAAAPPETLIAAAAQPSAGENAKPPSVAEVADEETKPATEAAAGDEGQAEEKNASASSRGKKAKRGSAASKRDRASASDDAMDEPESSKPSKSSAKNDIDDLLAGAPSKSSKSVSSSIDDLLDSAVSGKKAAAKPEAKEPASDLPATPGRDQMLAALNKAKAKAGKCKGTGVATAAIQISGSSGKATSVNVTGVDGPAGSCVEKAVRSTPFPKFQKDKFEVKFPFKLSA